MQARPHKRGRILFSPQVIETIRGLIEQGKSAHEIAAAIGSTAASVRVKCSLLKIKLRRKRCGLVVCMRPAIQAALEAKAFQMRESPSELSARLLESIVEGDLYKAVLDDQETAPLLSRITMR